MKPSTCIITGGAGFIGCEVSHLIEKEFDNIIVVDNLHPQIHQERIKPSRLSSKANLFENDVTDAIAWDEVLSKYKPDVIIHLAAETGTGQSLNESSRHANVNVLGTTQMLDALVRNKAIPTKMILASSRAVYGEGKWIKADGVEFYPGQRDNNQLEEGAWDFEDAEFVPMNSANNVPMPTSIYGSTKLAQENIIACWCKSYDVNYTIFRFQNVYGPGQSLINPYTGIVSLFVRMAKEKKSIPLYEDGEMLRDFVYISDVANAITETLYNPKSNNCIIDIGSGQKKTIADIAELIAARYDAPKPHVCGKYRNGDVRHAASDISTTLEILEWRPQVSVEQGINQLCDWIDEVI